MVFVPDQTGQPVAVRIAAISVLRAVAVAGGSALWTQGGYPFEEAVKLCLAGLEDGTPVGIAPCFLLTLQSTRSVIHAALVLHLTTSRIIAFCWYPLFSDAKLFGNPFLATLCRGSGTPGVKLLVSLLQL